MPKTAKWKRYTNQLIAAEISTLTRYYDRVIQWLPRKDDTGVLLNQLDAKQILVIRETESFPNLMAEREARTAVLLNGTLNHHYDIQGLLMQLKPLLSRTSRVILVAYSPYLSWLYSLANKLRVRKGEVPTTFVTRVDLENIAKLAAYTIVRARPVVYFPWCLWGLGDFLNRVLTSVPGLRWFSFAYIAVLRPLVPETVHKPSLTCVVPARNEKGNIENVLKRMPNLGCDLEIIFVEGHSDDGTWEEIQWVVNKYSDRFRIKAFQQTGRGKGDAVRLGFSKASGDLLTILDADLTMPPELVGRFYKAYCDGHSDFINGSRLVYPMEGKAMRFLNRLGNVLFAKALSWVLDVRIGDSLCGTKLLARHDYERMVAWRNDFGDFDPFGDFELIFPAAVLGLGIVDIPIRYLDRTYGKNEYQSVPPWIHVATNDIHWVFSVSEWGEEVEMEAIDNPSRISEIRETIVGKHSLKQFYEKVYKKYAGCLRHCPQQGFAIELGSGAGFAKTFVPELITTDVIPYEGVDLVIDGTKLPFPDHSLRLICMMDVFHHISDVESFFSGSPAVSDPRWTNFHSRPTSWLYQHANP